ncbi:hypothetical protein N7494_003735 [Penicillium frequentans]|uniref:Uncharacterized protein n=1 Tax=Penicillium frequentans TaxID=3151616 RepID=A0AAD6GFZ5_9EURO|nr:hypothetical protein N7494_003735 [Penicillium glabrum]
MNWQYLGHVMNWKIGEEEKDALSVVLLATSIHGNGRRTHFISDGRFVSISSLIVVLEPRFCGGRPPLRMIDPFAQSLEEGIAPVTGGWAASSDPGAGYETGHITAPCVPLDW